MRGSSPRMTPSMLPRSVKVETTLAANAERWPARALIAAKSQTALVIPARCDRNRNGVRPLHDTVVVGDEIDRGRDRYAPDIADFFFDNEVIVPDHANVTGFVVLDHQAVDLPDAPAGRHHRHRVDDAGMIDVA